MQYAWRQVLSADESYGLRWQLICITRRSCRRTCFLRAISEPSQGNSKVTAAPRSSTLSDRNPRCPSRYPAQAYRTNTSNCRLELMPASVSPTLGRCLPVYPLSRITREPLLSTEFWAFPSRIHWRRPAVRTPMILRARSTNTSCRRFFEA